MAETSSIRHLVLVFGDQLDPGSAAFDGFDRERDAVLMMEVAEEASYVPQHRLRVALFLAAMRHHRDALRRHGRRVLYSELEDAANTQSFAGEIRRIAATERPARIVLVEPGDFRVRALIEATAGELGIPLEIRSDGHFLCPRGVFDDFAGEHPSLILENFYRMMRRRLGVLLTRDGKPEGGAWNFDRENRESLKRGRRPDIPALPAFAPDAVTRGAIAAVARRFPDAPGELDAFDLPVTEADATKALADFVAQRLARFGTYQDAMLEGEPFLWHSRLSAALNLHLLDPREVVDAAVAAYEAGTAPLNAVEGFVRQVIGWREFVRGVYWRHMPGYAGMNALGADLPMPRFMWTGETEMRCVADAVRSLLRHAYAHHIQRLMVLGQLALLLGVRPYDVHRWHLSMFADAIDWVSLPNTLGMSQHGDGGIVGTKPYCASGAYIDRMSDHCRSCRYDPRKAEGEDACPFTTLYWDFLARHRERHVANGRMQFQVKNLDRKPRAELAAIRRQAERVRAAMTAATFL